MANKKIDVPGDDDVSLLLKPTPDTLTINFVDNCRFCCTAGTENYFIPALPVGEHNNGDSWTGTPQAAGASTTTEHHSVEKGKDCGAKKDRSPTRSIQIGSNMPQ